MTDLYKLPKDVLVKMLSTIREDTEKIYLDEIRRIKSCTKYIRNCNYENCFNFAIHNLYEDQKYTFKDIPLHCCHVCNSFYCEEHKHKLNQIKTDDDIYNICDKCSIIRENRSNVTGPRGPAGIPGPIGPG